MNTYKMKTGNVGNRIGKWNKLSRQPKMNPALRASNKGRSARAYIQTAILVKDDDRAVIWTNIVKTEATTAFHFAAMALEARSK